jgi:hypothetical protein
MKKVKLILLAFVLCLTSTILFAQAATPSVEGGIASFITGIIPAAWLPLATLVLSILFLLEQYLASTSTFKANSTFQLIGGWIASIYHAVTGK